MIKPGRELDALVAEKVMSISGDLIRIQWENHRVACHPHYSTDISAAWEVVEKFRMTIYSPTCSIAHGEYQRDESTWEVEAIKESFDVNRNHSIYEYIIDAEGDTAPHAICLAALKAVGVEV